MASLEDKVNDKESKGLIKKESLYQIIDEGLTRYSVINAVIYPMVWLGGVTFPLISNQTLAGQVARGAYGVTAYSAAFVGSYRISEHLIDNKLNPAGITQKITDNFYNSWKRISAEFAPSLISVANGITHWFGWPAFAVNAPFVSLYNKLRPIPVAKKSEYPSYMPKLSPQPA